MQTLELEKYDTVELDSAEILNIDGGDFPAAFRLGVLLADAVVEYAKVAVKHMILL